MRCTLMPCDLSTAIIEVSGPNFDYIFPHSSVTTIELKRK